MKIAAILSQFPRYDETFILRELKALHDAGVELRIFSLRRCRDKIVHPQAEELVPFTTYLPWMLSPEVICACLYWLCKKPTVCALLLSYVMRSFFRSPVQTIKNLCTLPKALAFARKMEGENIDLIHGLWATFPATVAKAVSDMLGRPWSFAAHAHDIYTPNPLLRDNLEAAALTMTCTEINRQNLVKLVPTAEDKIHLVHHGLDLSLFTPEKTVGRNNDTPATVRLVSVGSLFECKGYPALFSVIDKLRKNDIDARLDIVGDGPERGKLEARAKALGIAAAVTFSGYAIQEDMPAHYRDADIFILMAVPEIHWGIPNVVVEAMASGLPVLVTALPSLTNAFSENEVGAFLPLGSNEDRVAEAVVKISALAANPELRKQIGIAAREKVSLLFDTRECAKKMISLFEKTIGGDRA